MRMAMNPTRRRFATALAMLPPLWLAAGCAARAQGLRRDEQVLLFPSTARSLPEGGGQARIEAWVHELERRPGATALLAHYLDLDLSELPETESARFTARTQLFRVDSERGRVLQIRFDGEALLSLPASGADGRVSAVVSNGGAAHASDGPRWLEYAVLMPEEDPRDFAGRVLWLPQAGLSIVSDIDDTIKHTQVRDRREMLLNTFAREFAAVPGMAAWLQRCGAAEPAASFHYVSGGPHQLYPALAEFLHAQAFPQGTVHLRSIDLEREIFAAGSGTHTHKLEVIGQLLEDFPQRRFVLVGDSGEQDPEVYGELARTFPGRIAAIVIRDVTGEPADAERYAQALRDVPPQLITLFTDPDRLPADGF
ncbi:MAG TPA: App1 family protein [Burkholderiales bacterium]